MATVADVMTRGVRTMTPSDTVVHAAQAMDELNVGVIPVCDGEKLVGMVTDRDIVVRGVAQEADPRTLKLADVMSTNVRCVTEDEDIDSVLGEMADTQIRRMPVVDGQQKLVGIVTLGDIAAKDVGDEDEVAVSLGDISSPAEPDRSGQSQASGPAGGGSASGSARPRRQSK
ncbi:CBS domain-containing protein [Ramlibacter sp.]|uniref:CBS domain-containing protein n=1 Tax=Ramlibacter sp. TaxID=1917967 RepID=UPI002C47DE2A|nr:CBS domain-containing protein [Ramlibacter sp.]HWI81948.1 CBS domain-containing protein [Ramlibacter sp.]